MNRTQPIVDVLHITPLHLSAHAIRECHNSHGKSDTATNKSLIASWSGTEDVAVCGPKDAALIGRVGVKMKHASTLEHINVTLSIRSISRALLQEWSRTRLMSQTVKSSRYTLAELGNYEDGALPYYEDDLSLVDNHFTKFLYATGHNATDVASYRALIALQDLIRSGASNDITKYAIPESFLTSLTATINFRSLRNMLALRTAPSALLEYRNLANAIYDAIPSEYQYLLEDCIYGN